MIRLLYISTASRPITPLMVDHILRTSRRNNAAVGVTGLLVTGGRRFLQALEGPDEAVQATYDRISADPRHFAVVQLAREVIGTRQFAQWTMGVQQGAPATGALAVSEAVRALIAPIGDASLRGYFCGFAQRQAAA
ncbi:BLUF domain-containing protein [uncultured Sphingomonas sp.]|uniref:BLUF domain-containing protein n=1 Tax=uncultured Sphingomonas sp. TaxID=158754 RepID=UPI0035CC5010